MIRFILAMLALVIPASVFAAPTVEYEQHFNGALPADWFNGAERYAGYPHTETRPGNKEYQQYLPSQAATEMGRLKLRAQRMTTAQHLLWARRIDNPKAAYATGLRAADGGLMYGPVLSDLERVDWVSGQISSWPKLPVAPGRIFTARFRLPVGANLFPGIWAFDYAGSTEVDLMEGSGRAASDPLGNVSQGIHDFKSNIHTGCAKKSIPTAGEHTAKLDWSDPTKIDFYMDGLLNCSVKATANMTRPMAIIINLAVGSGGWPWIGIPSAATPNPAEFLVDYVKVEKP